MVFQLLRKIYLLATLNKTRFFGTIVLVVVLAAVLSCSTKKNTFSRRVYHNLTAHYNAYFNGNEAYKEAVIELAKKNKDNFADVIPVFQYGTKADAQSVYGLLDRAIEKGSIVISKHSIFIKRVEYVKWIDDAYFLLGKSYLYKQDYELAAQTFSFIRNRYKGNSIVYDAVLYQVRTYSQMGKFSEAEALIALVDKKIEKNKANRNIEKFFPLVLADFYLQQDEYGKSIEFLEQALRLNKSKKIRTRISFILAQVYQRTGNISKATEYYRKTLNYNPVYEMEFASKINMAKCFDVDAGDSRMIKKQLRKMLNDDKNKDFLDQIYYALAEVYLKEADMPAAIENYKLSARKSTTNNYQKGISYLKLGDIYYAAADYKPAQMFYDSAVMSLPKEFPNFSLIESKKNTLTDLVKNINIVEVEDSIQILGRLPYAERMQKIDAIILAIIKEEERKKQEDIDRQIALNNLRQMGNQNNPNSEGKWYFENPQMISFGQTEFNKKWGNRKLEDLWRLSNKVAADFDFNDNNLVDADTSKADSSASYVFDPKDRNAYIKAIPTTPEAFAASDKRIMEALFNIGVIYKDGLEDYEKSIEAFETLFRRFENNPYVLQSYYYLYRIYTENEDFPLAEKYKNLIINGYPDSDYAKIISDPDYYQKIDSIKGLEEVFYSVTYSAFQDGQYEKVVHNADSASLTFGDKDLIPKFYFLKAISTGKLYGDSLMLTPLNVIVSKYSASPVAPMAQALLNVLNGNNGKGSNLILPRDTTKIIIPTDESPYVYDPEGFHFYISVFDAVKVKISEVKNLYSNHNTSMYKSDKLNVNSMFLNNSQQMITTTRFDNKLKAIEYYSSVNNNSEIMAKLTPANIKHFVISANNYTTFFRLKNVDQYLDFFNTNYLNQ